MTEPAGLETRVQYLCRAMARLEQEMEDLRGVVHRVSNSVNTLVLEQRAKKPRRARDG